MDVSGYRWMCLRGGGELMGAVQRRIEVPYWTQVFFRSQDCSWPTAGRCAGLQLLFSLIFCKKTHTDRYMYYNSHARIKSSIIKRLGTRTKKIVMPPNWLEKRKEPPKARLSSEWAPSTDGEPDSQEPPSTSSTPFHPNWRIGTDHPQNSST